MRFRQAILLGAALTGWHLVTWAQPFNYEAMKQMILAGNADKAYEQLVTRQYVMAGDVDFDYILGLAALQSGRPAEATLAFERVLAVKPEMLGARLDMARAYYELGNYDLAKQELQELQKLNPPAEAKKAMKQYLAAIEKGGEQTQGWSGFLSATLGRDSNVNDAGNSTIFIPVLGGNVTLGSSSVESPDRFMQLRAYGQYTRPINSKSSIYFTGDVKGRTHEDENSFNTRQIALGAGVKFQQDAHSFKLGGSYTRATLGGQIYRHVAGVGGEWAFSLNQKNTLGAFIQRNAIRYIDPTNASEDSNYSIAGLSWTHAVGESGKAILSSGLYGGYDEALGSRIDGSRHVAGGRAVLQYQQRDDLSLYGSLGIQSSRYQLQNSLFLENRRDDQATVEMGLNWEYAKYWDTNPYVSLVRNHSNIALDDYKGAEIGLTVKRTLN